MFQVTLLLKSMWNASDAPDKRGTILFLVFIYFYYLRIKDLYSYLLTKNLKIKNFL